MTSGPFTSALALLYAPLRGNTMHVTTTVLEHQLKDSDGNPVQLASWLGTPLLLIFLRHLL